MRSSGWGPNPTGRVCYQKRKTAERSLSLSLSLSRSALYRGKATGTHSKEPPTRARATARNWIVWHSDTGLPNSPQLRENKSRCWTHSVYDISLWQLSRWIQLLISHLLQYAWGTPRVIRPHDYGSKSSFISFSPICAHQCEGCPFFPWLCLVICFSPSLTSGLKSPLVTNCVNALQWFWFSESAEGSLRWHF